MDLVRGGPVNSEHRGGMIRSMSRRQAGPGVPIYGSAQALVPATTLGDVYSLVLSPASLSSRADPEQRAEIESATGWSDCRSEYEDVEDIVEI